MNIYVETNFVLEIVFAQEQHQSCEDLEATRLETTRAQLIKTSTVLPLDADVLTTATTYQTKYDLSSEDAIVYATVLSHLKGRSSGQSCFLNRNTRDFDDPDLVAELRRYDCKMMPRFDSGYQYIMASLRSSR